MPLVIAHRGASGYRPEHTLESYRLAVAQGADYIEPDLVPTRDGILVARHENDISDTTDVSARPEFADRKTAKVVDGQRVEGWFSEDFSLAELKSLRARGRNRDSAVYNDQFQIPTFAEVVDLAKTLSAETGRTIGLYPETKHPSYFRSIGLPIEDKMLETLREKGYEKATDPVFIQSFEVGNLKELSQKTELKLVQLVDSEGGPEDLKGQGVSYADMITPKGLSQIAQYADVVAPNKQLLAGGLIGQAHLAGLAVHSWTFRAENQHLPKEFQNGSDPQGLGDLAAEVRGYLAQGLDGVFANHPDFAVAARQTL